MLGVGDFYYEVGVQVVELCVATSHRNGGVLSLEEVQRRLNSRRRHDNHITSDDIVRAVKKLHVLGSGMAVVASGSSQFIYSIPGELSMDHTALLQLAESVGSLTVAGAADSLGWTEERTGRAIEHLLLVGVTWRDDQASPPSYWFPAFFYQCATAE